MHAALGCTLLACMGRWADWRMPMLHTSFCDQPLNRKRAREPHLLMARIYKHAPMHGLKLCARALSLFFLRRPSSGTLHDGRIYTPHASIHMQPPMHSCTPFSRPLLTFPACPSCPTSRQALCTTAASTRCASTAATATPSRPPRCGSAPRSTWAA